MLEDSKNEIQNILDIENQTSSFIQQKHRDIEKYGDINPFDSNNDTNQKDEEFIPNDFLDLAEINKTKYERTLVFDVIVDSQRFISPFMLNGKFNINDGEPFQVNRTYIKTLIN